MGRKAACWAGFPSPECLLFPCGSSKWAWTFGEGALPLFSFKGFMTLSVCLFVFKLNCRAVCKVCVSRLTELKGALTSSEGQRVLLSSVNPGKDYYLGANTLIICVRLFGIKNAKPEQRNIILAKGLVRAMSLS